MRTFASLEPPAGDVSDSASARVPHCTERSEFVPWEDPMGQQAWMLPHMIERIVLVNADGSNIEIDCKEGIQALPKEQQPEARSVMESVTRRMNAMLGRRGTVATRRR